MASVRPQKRTRTRPTPENESGTRYPLIRSPRSLSTLKYKASLGRCGKRIVEHDKEVEIHQLPFGYNNCLSERCGCHGILCHGDPAVQGRGINFMCVARSGLIATPLIYVSCDFGLAICRSTVLDIRLQLMHLRFGWSEESQPAVIGIYVNVHHVFSFPRRLQLDSCGNEAVIWGIRSHHDRGADQDWLDASQGKRRSAGILGFWR